MRKDYTVITKQTLNIKIFLLLQLVSTEMTMMGQSQVYVNAAPYMGFALKGLEDLQLIILYLHCNEYCFQIYHNARPLKASVSHIMPSRSRRHETSAVN